MTITFELRSPVSRLATIVAVMCGCAAYISLSAARFVISVITDPEARAETAIIEGAANYFPNSAWAQARMASRLIESGVDLSEDHERTAERAVYYSARAVALAPRNYEFRMLLAAAKELSGDLAEAEMELRAALKLAPHQVNVHWRLANLLLREEKLDEAGAEFRLASEADPELLTPTLNLLWQASDGKIETLNAAVGTAPEPQLALAQFLIEREKFEVAVKIANSLDRRAALNLPNSGKLLDSLISAGRIDLASYLWRNLSGAESQSLMWNEGFETPIRSNFAQFDWNLSQSKYAKIGITTATARTGQGSLRISYNGIDTTTLDNEIRQLVKARPGARYTLTCYVKADGLVTPGGPQVVVTLQGSSTPIGASAAIEAGSYDWRILTADFVAPPNAHAVVIAIKQTPRFSYVDPTSGTAWFDDFVLTER
ncbi:MAG TPA: tetratricopeptide repeat protein [Blastocatellia bacterium]|nr:tetratricopeptide repeat protein [Blastocatellia bacterium]